MMRIAVLTPYFPIREQPYRGHSAYQTLRRMQQWTEIAVFCPIPRYPRWLEPRSYRYIRADLDYSPPDMRARYFAYPMLPVLSRPFSGWLCSRLVLPLLETFKPDLILNYWVYPDGYAAVLAGRKLGVPVVVSAIGSDLRRIPDAITLWLTRKTLRQASAVITVSKELRSQAIRLGAPPERVHAVLNGSDTSIFSPADRTAARLELGLDATAEIVVFVGSLLPAKGLAELLQATAALASSRPRLQVFCIGEGSMRTELETRAQRAGLAGRFRFPGACSSSQVARWLAAADLFCLPSYSEGCPNALVEALACGRPAVATGVGGIPELLNPTCGVLVPPRDAARLAAALAQALTRSWEEPAIAAQFRRGWDQPAAETLEICRRIAAGAGYTAAHNYRDKRLIR